MRLGPNGLRHIEQSLQAVAGVGLPIGRKLEILSIIDDYVVGHCTSLMRRGHLRIAGKAASALSEAINRYLDEGDYPHVRAMIGGADPVDAFVKHPGFMTDDYRFDIGLDALLDGFAKRFKLT